LKLNVYRQKRILIETNRLPLERLPVGRRNFTLSRRRKNERRRSYEEKLTGVRRKDTTIEG
jgi:hypothetical protein